MSERLPAWHSDMTYIDTPLNKILTKKKPNQAFYICYNRIHHFLKRKTTFINVHQYVDFD